MQTRFIQFVPKVFCIVFALGLSTPSAAATLAEAQALIDAGNQKAAAAILDNLAESGDSEAQIRLANLYRDGVGVRRNAITACYWFQAAAKQGLISGQYETGICRLNGLDGEPANASSGAKWLNMAVEGGHTPALCPLGELYVYGNGVLQNVEQGHELCLRAANEGNVSAQASIGQMYLLGHLGVGQEAKGAEWIGKAAAAGDAASQFNMGQILWRGRGLPQDQIKAQSYIAAAAQQGHAKAQFWLGRHLIRVAQKPDGTIQPYEAAAAYYWLALVEGRPLDPQEQTMSAEWIAELRRGLSPKVISMVDEKVAAWSPRTPEESIEKLAPAGK